MIATADGQSKEHASASLSMRLLAARVADIATQMVRVLSEPHISFRRRAVAPAIEFVFTIGDPRVASPGVWQLLEALRKYRAGRGRRAEVY